MLERDGPVKIKQRVPPIKEGYIWRYEINADISQIQLWNRTARTMDLSQRYFNEHINIHNEEEIYGL